MNTEKLLHYIVKKEQREEKSFSETITWLIPELKKNNLTIT
jgi:predicted CopG family antitoxin